MANNRASLLNGLRTGGVRSTSYNGQLQTETPLTASVGGQFSRRLSTMQSQGFPFEGDDDFGVDLTQYAPPMTAPAVDTTFQTMQQYVPQAALMQAQLQAYQRALLVNSMSGPYGPDPQARMQMQLEMLKLQVRERSRSLRPPRYRMDPLILPSSGASAAATPATTASV
jgi:hypothetical protein